MGALKGVCDCAQPTVTRGEQTRHVEPPYLRFLNGKPTERTGGFNYLTDQGPKAPALGCSCW